MLRFYVEAYIADVAEWLRRLTRNQIPSGSVGSNPTICDCLLVYYTHLLHQVLNIKIIIADEDEMPTEACDAHEISSLNHSAISFSFHKKYHILIFVNIKMVNYAL